METSLASVRNTSIKPLLSAQSQQKSVSPAPALIEKEAAPQDRLV
jgi:hypothetical protein